MERRCKNRKPAAASEEPGCVVHDVPDDLLRLILLRLDSPLWLFRAACACKRWRRIVDGGDGGRAFLRLARSLHPPVVVRHDHSYHVGGHRFVPTSSATTLPILPSLNDFSTWELLQRHHTIVGDDWRHWHVADCHGGLALLRKGFDVVSDLVVCDLLSRRCRDIHLPPHLQISRPPMGSDLPRLFLLDSGDDDDGDGGNISISNFRVLYCSDYYHHHDNLSKVYVFSTADAGGGGWRLVRQSTEAVDDDDDDDLFESYMGQVIGRIDRCLYLATPDGSVRVLDNAGALEFSEVDLPIRVRKSGSDNEYSTFAVVHGGSPEPTASPATASFIVHVCRKDLELFRRIPSSGEWVLEHSIPRLSEATRGLQGHPEPSRWREVDVVAGGTRLAVLKVSLRWRRRGDKWSWSFCLDVNTMQLQAMPDVEPKIYTLPWPQSLH